MVSNIIPNIPNNGLSSHSLTTSAVQNEKQAEPAMSDTPHPPMQESDTTPLLPHSASTSKRPPSPHTTTSANDKATDPSPSSETDSSDGPSQSRQGDHTPGTDSEQAPLITTQPPSQTRMWYHMDPCLTVDYHGPPLNDFFRRKAGRGYNLVFCRRWIWVHLEMYADGFLCTLC